MNIHSIRLPGAVARVPAVCILFVLSACTNGDPGGTTSTTAVDRTLASTGAAPGSPGGHDLGPFPLTAGDAWDYEGCFRTTLTEDGSPVSAVIYRDEHHSVVGTESRPEGEYRLIEQVIHEYPTPTSDTTWWERLRQTRTGLFELDVPLTDPPLDAPAAIRASAAQRDAAWQRLSVALPASDREAYHRAWMSLMEKHRMLTGVVAAAGLGREGVRKGEITRLAYPLRPGRTWVVREDPMFVATVEASEQLDLTVGKTRAWRIRIDIEGASPFDRVVLWYGAPGFLGQSAHLVTIATDENGQPVGTLVGDDLLLLTDTNVNAAKGIQ